MTKLTDTSHHVANRIRDFVRSPYAPILVVYVALRVVAAAGISVMRHPDSNSWTWLDFSGSDVRLWTVPLFFKLLPNDAFREAGQVGLSILCWGSLAGVTACATARRNLKVIGFAVVLIVSLTVDVTMWDTTILGESVAISVTVGAIAAWWIFVMRPSWVTAGLVCAAVLLWAFLRHTNVVVTIALAATLAVALLIRAGRKYRVVIFAVVVVTLIWGVPAIGKNRFNEDEVILTVVSERVLTSPERTEWFAKHGMPAGEDVRALAGKFDQGYGSFPFRENKKLFRWVEKHGRSTYFDFLRTHPGYLFILPVEEAIGPDAAVLSGAHPTGYETHPYGFPRAVLPTEVGDAIFGGAGPLTLLSLLVFGLALAAFGLRGWTGRELVPLMAFVLSLFLYLVTYHGVATEVGRHYMLSALAIRISLILIGLLAIDRLFSGSSERKVAHIESEE